MQPVPDTTMLPLKKKLGTSPCSSPNVGSILWTANLCQNTSKSGIDPNSSMYSCPKIQMNGVKDVNDIACPTRSRETPPALLDNSVTTKRTKKQRAMQQQLLLLHHAAKCDHASSGSLCSATPHCARIQMLWNHIASCTSNDSCSVKSCRTSRVILGHFMKCKSDRCQICLPTRMMIARAKENKRLDRNNAKTGSTIKEGK